MNVTRENHTERPEIAEHDPSLYLNRELSWLDFNDRVLELAEDWRVPLLERVKFCAIWKPLCLAKPYWNSCRRRVLL